MKKICFSVSLMLIAFNYTMVQGSSLTDNLILNLTFDNPLTLIKALIERLNQLEEKKP